MPFDPSSAVVVPEGGGPTGGFDPASAKVIEDTLGGLPGVTGGVAEKLGTLEDPAQAAVGAVETALQLGSGAVAAPVSGLVGGAVAPFIGGEKASDLIKTIQEKGTYQPQSPGGEALSSIVNAPGAALAEGGYRAGGELSDAGFPAAGAGVNALVQIIPALAAEELRPAAARQLSKDSVTGLQRMVQNRQADRNIREFKKAGFGLDPAATNPTVANRLASGLGSKEQLWKTLSTNNQPLVDTMGRVSLGLTPTSQMSEGFLNSLREHWSGPSTEIENLKDAAGQPELFFPTKAYREAIQNLQGKLAAVRREAPGAVANPKLNTLLDTINPVVKEATETEAEVRNPKEFTAAAAIQLNRVLRARASKNLSVGATPEMEELGDAQHKVADALETMIEDNLKQIGREDLYQGYHRNRELIARSYDVQSALQEDGHINGQVFGRLMDKGRPLGGGLEVIGKLARTQPKVLQPPSMVGGNPLSTWDLGMGFGGAGMMHYLLPPNLAGPASMAALVARPGTRALVSSDFYQNAMVNPPRRALPAPRLAILKALASRQLGPGMAVYQGATQAQQPGSSPGPQGQQ